MKKATKKPADSQRKTSGAAASILAQMGGAEAVTVHVFRRIEGGKHAFLRAYSADEAEHIQDRVLTDHGPGFYLVQVKEGTKIAGSSSISCGDVSQLTPPTTPVQDAKPAKSDDEVGGGMLLKMLLAQQQQTTAIMTAMIGAQASRPVEGLGVKDVLALLTPMMQDRSGIGEALEAIKVAQELSPGDSGGGGGGVDAAGLIGAIGQIAAAIPAAIRELKNSGAPAARRPVENTANQNTSSRAATGGVGNGTSAPAEVAASAGDAASPPEAGSPIPPPSVERVRLPFPGADVIAARVRSLLAMAPGDELLSEDALGNMLDEVCNVAMEEIDLAGGEVAHVLDWYTPEFGGIGEALCQFDPGIKRAARPLHKADKRIREMMQWEPAPADDRDQT